MVAIATMVPVMVTGVWWKALPSGDFSNSAEAGAAASGEPDSLRASARLNSSFSTDMAQPVTGAEVIRDTLWISVDVAGRAEAVHRATLSAQVAGVVETIGVQENSRVEAGQVLLNLETAEHSLAIARAESDLRRVRADYEQMVLFDDHIEDARVKAQRKAIARARSGVDQGEIILQQAQLSFERSRIKAPFEGRVADLEVVSGQHVMPGKELMTVVDLDPIKVVVHVLEAEMVMLEEGRPASVRFPAFPGERFESRIETVSPVIDAELRAGQVTVLLANPGGRIKPGMYAEVSLAASSFPDRLLVPRSAILERGEGVRRPMMFVLEEIDGEARARWRYVTTGIENDSLVEVLPADEGSVEVGATVLVDGHQFLSHDALVRPVGNVIVEGERPGR